MTTRVERLEGPDRGFAPANLPCPAESSTRNLSRTWPRSRRHQRDRKCSRLRASSQVNFEMDSPQLDIDKLIDVAGSGPSGPGGAADTSALSSPAPAAQKPETKTPAKPAAKAPAKAAANAAGPATALPRRRQRVSLNGAGTSTSKKSPRSRTPWAPRTSRFACTPIACGASGRFPSACTAARCNFLRALIASPIPRAVHRQCAVAQPGCGQGARSFSVRARKNGRHGRTRPAGAWRFPERCLEKNAVRFGQICRPQRPSAGSQSGGRGGIRYEDGGRRRRTRRLPCLRGTSTSPTSAFPASRFIWIHPLESSIFAAATGPRQYARLSGLRHRESPWRRLPVRWAGVVGGLMGGTASGKSQCRSR